MIRPTLTYFAARGRAELIRIILAEAGAEYDEHPVGHGTPPVNDRPTDFGALKKSGTLPFDAVPVWDEPDGFRLAQSGAIAMYLAGRHGLLGAGAHEQALCHQMLGAQDDVRGELRRLVSVDEAQRPQLREELGSRFLPRWMGYLERLLSRGDGAHFVGTSLTLADLTVFYLAEIIADNGWGETIAARPRLAALVERVGARPRVAAYVRSPKRFPFVPLPR